MYEVTNESMAFHKYEYLTCSYNAHQYDLYALCFNILVVHPSAIRLSFITRIKSSRMLNALGILITYLPILLLSTHTRNTNTRIRPFSADVHCAASSATQAQNIVSSCSSQFSSCESCLSTLSPSASGPVSSGSLCYAYFNDGCSIGLCSCFYQCKWLYCDGEFGYCAGIQETEVRPNCSRSVSSISQCRSVLASPRDSKLCYTFSDCGSCLNRCATSVLEC